MQNIIIKFSIKLKNIKKKPLNLFNKASKNKINVTENKIIKIEIKD